MTARMLLPSTLVCLAACGSSTTVSFTPTPASDAFMAQTIAVGSFQAMDLDDLLSANAPVSQDSNASQTAGHSSKEDSSTQLNTSLQIAGCDGTVLGQTSSDANSVSLTATFTLNSDTCNTVQRLGGTQQVAVQFTRQGRAEQVSTNLVRTYQNGDTLTTTSANPNLNFSFDVAASGATVATAVAQQVGLNEHCVRQGATAFVFDLTTEPAAPLATASGFSRVGLDFLAVSHTITGGTATVHDTQHHFTAINTFTNLGHGLQDNCACPESGSVTQQVSSDDGRGSYQRTYTFSSCGTAEVVTSGSTVAGVVDGTATVEWQDCTP